VTGDSRDAEATRRRKARRDALVTHAVRLTSRDEGGWHRVPLSRYLAKAHKLSESTILVILDEAPELASIGFMIKPRRYRRTQFSVTDRPSGDRTWRDVEADVDLFLNEIQTDAVHVEIAGAQGGVALRMRLDFVQDLGGPAIWLACLVEGRIVHRELTKEQPLTLGSNWSLPLVPAASPPTLPEVLVWRTSSPRAASGVVRAALEQRLGVPARRVRLRRDSCTPRELDLRASEETTIRRLRDHRGRKDIPIRACDRCGQPLSDPASVALGIGPECRKYYAREVLAAVRKPGRTPSRRGTKTHSAWIGELLTSWGPRRSGAS
jgi:hypothetical protein